MGQSSDGDSISGGKQRKRGVGKTEEKVIQFKKLQANMAQHKNITIDENGRSILMGILKND